MEEIRLSVVGYEGYYEVSNIGRVKSLARKDHRGHTLKEKIIKGRPEGRRRLYRNVGLRKGGLFTVQKIHRLVALAFIPNTDNKPQVNHKNGIPHDNRVENLEWMTNAENVQHGYDVLKNKGAWFGKTGKNNPSSRKVSQYTSGGILLKNWDCIREAATDTGSDRVGIIRCCQGTRASAGGYKRAYAFSEDI